MTSYQKIRAAGKSMHDKVLVATSHLDFHPLRAAKRMGIPLNGRQMIFDGEAAQNAFFDFWHYEYRVDGKTMSETVDPVTAGLTPLETEALEAGRVARTSFFHLEGVNPKEHQIRLRDLLDPTRPEVILTDIGLSASLQRSSHRLALFLRPVTLRGITMTSGFTFGFDTELEPGILEGHRQKTKKVPPADLSEARFVFFFKKYRQLGLDQLYQDVV